MQMDLSKSGAVPQRGSFADLMAAKAKLDEKQDAPPAVKQTAPQTFHDFHTLGYTRLVPIIPPRADVSERSSLHKRVGTRQDARGKSPGIRGRDGKWFGFDWVPYQTDERDLDRWAAMGAGIGIKTGQGLIAIDADTTNETFARIIRDVVDQHFGRLPIRVGRYPKALYLCRVSGDLPYQRVEFGPRDERGNAERVEILTDRKQFVAHGTHPVTGKSYEWTRPLVSFDDLPVFTPAQITTLMEKLRSALPDAGKVITEGAGADVDQSSLKGSLEHVRKAVSALPNVSALFPSREHYRDIGYAIKAALPEHEAEAFEMFADWCARWTDGDNEPDVVAADWSRMKPPFRRGASWLYELAEQHGGGQFSRADIWFEDEQARQEENPFVALQVEDRADEKPVIWSTPFVFKDFGALPPREWVYGTHLIRKFVSATVAPGGLGKSSLTIVETLAMATGKELLGARPRGRFRVWYWNGEDPRDELERRFVAAMLHYGLTQADIDGWLRVDTGREMPLVLAHQTRNGAKIYRPMREALVAHIKEHKIDVLQLDPFVSTHQVTENDNNAIDMVAKEWARIADETNIAIELVHHTRKTNGAETSIEDSRGAIALIQAARSARSLTRMAPREATSLGVLPERRSYFFRFGGDPKANLAPPAISDRTTWFETTSVDIGNGSIDGQSVGVVRLSNFVLDRGEPDDREQAALGILSEGEWREHVNSGERWAGVAIGSAFDLDPDDKEDRIEIKAIFKRLKASGAIRIAIRKDENRRTRPCVEVVQKNDAAEIFG